MHINESGNDIARHFQHSHRESKERCREFWVLGETKIKFGLFWLRRSGVP